MGGWVWMGSELDAPVHPSATILWPRVTCFFILYVDNNRYSPITDSDIHYCEFELKYNHCLELFCAQRFIAHFMFIYSFHFSSRNRRETNLGCQPLKCRHKETRVRPWLWPWREIWISNIYLTLSYDAVAHWDGGKPKSGTKFWRYMTMYSFFLAQFP